MKNGLLTLRGEIVDVLIVVLLYVLVEFTRTESVAPTDWSTWFWGAVMGGAYRAAPEIITFLGKLRGARV
ncbi:MAG: hypothetical protein IPH53_20560 [Flavobacteriales bacterium]|nr:hypothetical protein [Flavobacteriales bacterium]